jgi:hypothetical protein
MDMLRVAIEDRRPVALWYERRGARTVHPHVWFVTPERLEHVNGYQIDGPTTPGNPLPGWRNFDLRRVERVELLEGRFDIRDAFDPSSSKYHRVLASVR